MVGIVVGLGIALIHESHEVSDELLINTVENDGPFLDLLGCAGCEGPMK
jgi:hypothetical protein